jgi:hypothetical protein
VIRDPWIRQETIADGAAADCTNGVCHRMHGKGKYTDPEGVPWVGKFFNGKYESGRSYVTLR